jgi:D-aminoacyl-tRNA deacylase
MRLVVQRVEKASVTVDGKILSEIGKGLLVLFAVHKEDEEAGTKWLANKLVNLRIFSDESGKMNLSVKEVGGEVLVVSQFTLYGTCSKGRRPEFTQSAGGEKAERLYNKFVSEVKEELGRVQTGQFAAHMSLSLVNDGPVTLIID